MTLAELQSAFRTAAAAIDPQAGTPVDPSPLLVRAWLTVQSVRTQPRWLTAAEDAVQPIAAGTRRVDDDAVAAWVLTCCLGWVQRASGPFRAAAERLLPRLPDSAEAVPALLGWWRITGRRDARDRALALAQQHPSPRALHAAWLATAEVRLWDAARSLLGSAPHAPADWPLAADLSDLDPDHAALAGLAPAEIVLATAPLAAPPLHLDVHWHIAEELAEGPMAEAATFPWPALRIRFHPMAQRDQIRFEARLADGPTEELEDVGVVAAWLEEITRAADRGPLLDGAPVRSRRRGGLRRR